MAKKPHNPNPNGRKGNPISLAPLTPAQALGGFLKISKADAKQVIEEARPARPTGGRKK
jgi:hypothetical protein